MEQQLALLHVTHLNEHDEGQSNEQYQTNYVSSIRQISSENLIIEAESQFLPQFTKESIAWESRKVGALVLSNSDVF